MITYSASIWSFILLLTVGHYITEVIIHIGFPWQYLLRLLLRSVTGLYCYKITNMDIMCLYHYSDIIVPLFSNGQYKIYCFFPNKYVSDIDRENFAAYLASFISICWRISWRSWSLLAGKIFLSSSSCLLGLFRSLRESSSFLSLRGSVPVTCKH